MSRQYLKYNLQNYFNKHAIFIFIVSEYFASPIKIVIFYECIIIQKYCGIWSLYFVRPLDDVDVTIFAHVILPQLFFNKFSVLLF